jgi:hypothetical protein
VREITITVNESDIEKLVVEKIAIAMAREYTGESIDAKHGIRKGVEQAVKDYVYSRKDEIIERCVEQASFELVKKGLPKLIEKMEVNNEQKD